MFIRSSLVAVGVTALLCTAPALAQHTRPGIPLGAPAPATAPDGRAPGSVSTTTNSPTGERGAGIDSYHAVNPAPGAGEHPFVGHSEDAFYHVRDRIARVEQRAGGLRGSERRRALSGIRSIRAELARQVARHGEVRDWDREHLNKRLDVLEGQVGLPRGNGAAFGRG